MQYRASRPSPMSSSDTRLLFWYALLLSMNLRPTPAPVEIATNVITFMYRTLTHWRIVILKTKLSGHLVHLSVSDSQSVSQAVRETRNCGLLLGDMLNLNMKIQLLLTTLICLDNGLTDWWTDVINQACTLLHFLHSTCWLIARNDILCKGNIWSGSTCALSCWINTIRHVNFRDLSAKVKCISNACMYIKISLIVFYLEGDFSSPVPRWDICVRWKYEMLLYVVHAGRVGDLYHKCTTSYFNHNLPDPCEKIKFHLWNKCKHCSYWCWHSPLQSHFNIYTAVWL